MPDAGSGAGPDKGGALPRKRRALVIRNGRAHRQDDGSNLGRWAKAQVDPSDIAVGRALLQQLDQPAAEPHGGGARLVAGAARQGVGIEQQDEVDVRAVVELSAAELAEG